MAWCGTIALLSQWPALARAQMQAPPRYRLSAAVAQVAPHIEGVLEVGFTNHSHRVLDEAVFVLFPNRFSKPDEGINDFNRQFVYPEQDFDPGALTILEADDGGRRVALAPVHQAEVPDGSLVRLPITPLAPGATRSLRLRFRTVVPHRFGSFGEFDGQLTLIGGWYPYLAALSADGSWQLDAPPPLADFEVELSIAPELEAVLNGHHIRRAEAAARLRFPSVHYLSLVAAPELRRRETTAGGTRIVIFQRPPRRTLRHSFGPTPDEIVSATLHDIIARCPQLLSQRPAEVIVVQAPLRLSLTAAAEGMAVISDRALKVHWLLRPFHELRLAQALYAEMLRPQLSAREPAQDYWWVSDGLARVLADRFVAQARPNTPSVQDWIDRFNIFAIVDRFESVPKIPFVEAFFERARVADPLHSEIATFNSSRPPGRVVLNKLREVVGPEQFAALVDRCAGAAERFRGCVSAAGDLDWVFDQWLQPYPALNYRLGTLRLNQRQSDTYRHQLSLLRDSSRPVTEPVTVRLRSSGGRELDLRWDGRGDVGHLSAETTAPVRQAVLDPERRLIEDRRDDNFQPPSPQLVLDSAEVEISSTEFGFSGLMVGRRRYDYRRDLAAAAFYTNRSLGFAAGARAHWGTPIDATTYRHNLYAFYGFQGLNGSFTDARRPNDRTRGQLAALGLRYDYTNVFAWDNPTRERNLRLYADWYDRSLGGNYDYVDWGARLIGTHPLWSHRTIGALEVLNGFSEPLDGSRVPNQGLYSLGGSRSIRGIGAEDELGRNIFLLRGELRQAVYPEVDWNLLDLLVLRRGQLRLFADSGRVSNATERIYDAGGWAVGVGAGFAAVYEFLGFFPSLAYIEVATRVDEPRKAGDVQFLFGTRQAF
ncbi:MAG: hypothetical protein HY699_22745 [Deltaproteobacteria bacterium]|nr:hypothetical protein [Deltaproteobacteria bacterium]